MNKTILNDLSLSEKEKIILHMKNECSEIQDKISELEATNCRLKIVIKANGFVIESYKHALTKLNEATDAYKK
jgi:hypothetical protein